MKKTIRSSVFYDAIQINEKVFYSKEEIFGKKLTLKEAVDSRLKYLEKVSTECNTAELLLKVESLELQIAEINDFIPDDEIRAEIKSLGLEHLISHKENLERTIRLGNSIKEEALNDYNFYSKRYADALEFLEQYDIQK